MIGVSSGEGEELVASVPGDRFSTDDQLEFVVGGGARPGKACADEVPEPPSARREGTFARAGRRPRGSGRVRPRSRHHEGMRLYGERVTAPRMLLLDHIAFDPGCHVFELAEPLFLDQGDQVWRESDSVVVARVGGTVERPAGGLVTWNRRWRLV